MKSQKEYKGKNDKGHNEIKKSSEYGISRRDVLKLTAVSLAGAGLSNINSLAASVTPESNISSVAYDKKTRSDLGQPEPLRNVQYEELLPDELEIILKEYPVVYVPFGSLEWHGKHLPYGNDALKAHGILVRAAQKYGGVVVPPTYWGHMGHWQMGNHPGLSSDLTDRLFIEIFNGLVTVGFRVIIGVTGHDVKPQVDSLQKAVDSISAYLISPLGRTVGFAMMEGTLNPDDPDVGMDHAAKWETSILMALRPDLVEMKRIQNVDRNEIETGKGMNINGCGISGKDPRVYASKEIGEKAIEKIADKIGQKGEELLRSINWKKV